MNKALAQFKMDKVQMNNLSGGIVCTFFNQSDRKIMKLNIIIILLLVFSSVCLEANTRKNFSLLLNISNSPIQQNVYMFYVSSASDGSETHLLDSCLIKTDQKQFLLEGYINEENQVYVTFEKYGPIELPILVRPGDHLETIVGAEDNNQWNYPPKMVTSSLHQDEYNSFKEQVSNTSIANKFNFYKQTLETTNSPYIAYMCYIFSTNLEKTKSEIILGSAMKKFPNYERFREKQKGYRLKKETNSSKQFHKRLSYIINNRLKLLISGKNEK